MKTIEPTTPVSVRRRSTLPSREGHARRRSEVPLAATVASTGHPSPVLGAPRLVGCPWRTDRSRRAALRADRGRAHDHARRDPWAIRQLARYVFVVPVATVEGLSGRAALERSSAPRPTKMSTRAARVTRTWPGASADVSVPQYCWCAVASTGSASRAAAAARPPTFPGGPSTWRARRVPLDVRWRLVRSSARSRGGVRGVGSGVGCHLSPLLRRGCREQTVAMTLDCTFLPDRGRRDTGLHRR